MRKRILVVASDEATIDGLEAALEKIGLEPVVMRDRASVLARFEDLRPSAILMSVGRGPVDPLHVVAAIRDSNRGAIVPLLLMGSADPSEAITSPSEALEAGADYYFRLPTDLDYLAGRVAGWVGETHSTRPRPAQPIAEPRDGLSQDLDLEAFSLPSFDQEAVTEHGLPTLDLLREAEARRHDAALPGAPMGDDVHEDDEPTKGIFDVPDEMPVLQPRAPSRQVELALQLVREGERHRRDGNTNEAIDAYWAASETYVLDGRTSEAIALYKLILYLDPTRYVVARHGADIALQSGRKKDALDMYRHTARALEEAGRLDEATQVLREMVHMSPSEPTLVLRLAAIESRSQRTAAPRGPSLGAWGQELDAQLEAHEEDSLPELDVEPPTLDEGPTATKEVAPEAIEPILQRERAARVAEADALVVPDTIEISDPRVHMSLQASDTIPNQRPPTAEDEAEIGDPPQVIRAPPRAEPDEDRKKLLEAARQIDWERATRARKLQNDRDAAPRPPTTIDDEAEALTPLPTEAGPRRPDDTAPSAPVRGGEGPPGDEGLAPRPDERGFQRPAGDVAPQSVRSPPLAPSRAGERERWADDAARGGTLSSSSLASGRADDAARGGTPSAPSRAGGRERSAGDAVPPRTPGTSSASHQAGGRERSTGDAAPQSTLGTPLAPSRAGGRERWADDAAPGGTPSSSSLASGQADDAARGGTPSASSRAGGRDAPADDAATPRTPGTPDASHHAGGRERSAGDAAPPPGTSPASPRSAERGREARSAGGAAPPPGTSPASPAGERGSPAVPVDDLQSPDAHGVAARSSSATDPIHADRVASPRAVTAADPSLPNPGPRPRSPARTPTVTDPSLPDGEAPYAREPPPRGITTTEPLLQDGAKRPSATEGPEASGRVTATEPPEAPTPDEDSLREPLPRRPTQTDPVPVVDRPPSARRPPARATTTADAEPERVAPHRAATVSEVPRPSAPRAPSPTKPDAEPIVRPKEPTSTTKPRRPTVPATAELTGDLPSDGGTSDLDEPRKHRRPRPEPSRITFAPLVPNHGKVERLFDALIVFSLASTQRVTGILRMQGDEGLVFFEGHPAARRGARAHERLRQLLDRAGIALDRLVEDPPPSAADSIRAVVEAGLAQEELAQAVLHRHLEDGVLSALAYRGPWRFLQNNDVDIAISEIVKNRDDVIAQLVEILPQMAPPLELASHLGGTRARVRLEEVPDCGLSARDARFCSWLDGTKPLDVAATLGGLSMERAAAIALVLVAFGHGTSSGQPVPTEPPAPAAPVAPEAPPPSSGVMPHEALRSLEPRARLAALAELVRTSDYFTILGVDGSATKHQIDEAHHHLRRMIDVEVFESEPSLRATAREVARSLDEARDVLKVPQLRAAYQRHLKP
ncbi:MAG: hypothetical protein RIT81_34565 [Deltaproteobacteria bacterium]